MLTSQKELLKLAKQELEKNNPKLAREYLVQSLKDGFNIELALLLTEVYLLTHEEDQAYLTIKQVPDLFSDLTVFKTYQLVLQANHYYIEQQQLIYLLSLDESSSERVKQIELIKKYPVVAVKPEVQTKIINWFKKSDLNLLSTEQLFSLYQLDLPNFISLSQSFLLDEFTPIAVRISLISELVKLGVKKRVAILNFGKIKEVIPQNTVLFSNSDLVISGEKLIFAKLASNPVEMNHLFQEFIFVLQNLYPFEKEFIKNIDEFILVLDLFLKNEIQTKKNTESIQKITDLLKIIYSS